MDLNRHKNAVILPLNTEIAVYSESLNNTLFEKYAESIIDAEEINGFGLKVFKLIYRGRQICLNQLSFVWLRFTPSEESKRARASNIPARIFLNNHNVTLTFGSLVSPHQFKCAESKFIFTANYQSAWNLFFGKYDSCITINMGNMAFTIKHDHIDKHRGVIIDIKSNSNIVVHVCLSGNLEEGATPNGENGNRRRLYLQGTRDERWQPCFSALHLSICNRQNYPNFVHQSLHYLIQFLSYHSIPIYFGSIEFLNGDLINENNLHIPLDKFTYQYAWQMLNSIGCRMHSFSRHILHLFNGNNDDLLYFALVRLRRLAMSSESYFFNLQKELPLILSYYHDFYLQSIFYEMDKEWINYVRIPWFCITPTRLIVKPFKFMQSNRMFRYISNVSQSMAFVEFRDDTGTAYLSKELVPLLAHYLEHGLWFGDRHYIYLHHAQSQIRNKQFYFYCEEEGKMTREMLETWMGNFDDEKLPAKNTARRTQPFSSTEATIEIDKKWVDIIPDLKTKDGKYNFTDGVGKISSELNRLVHEKIGVDVDNGDYVSSVLQIRYGGCKGTVAVDPHLDGKEKQLIIRKSMMKFECEHQMLELCKRSLRRSLCINREVINLLSYRGISTECMRVYLLQNILWLMASLVSNQSALSVLREKALSVLSWSQISQYPHLSKEPFFRRLLHTTISNNLHQLVTRAHIRVSEARYMFGVVDEYAVLKEGQVFVQIIDENGMKIVLEGPVAITKNPCHHPGDLRVLEAVNNKSLHHLYDVLVFPQLGSRPHASEISGSDLDGDEYTVIWDPKLVPTSPNSKPYAYDSGPAPEPLDRVVTRNDRLKVILDICEQDNLGRLSNIHLVFVDKFGIDSKEAIRLAAGISQELDSVKSGQHPYTSEEISKFISLAGRTRPDFMQVTGYGEYPSDKALGKLFRSAHHLTTTFSKSFSVKDNPERFLDRNLLHDNFEEYIDFARNLYTRYQHEMLEPISSYGFSNEIDLFCCMESRNMKANERSDTQQTAKILLKAVFKHIRNEFHNGTYSLHEVKAKAAACYYVAYTDRGPKDKCMLSFPWLFAKQLLSDYPINSVDEETNGLMETPINSDWNVYQRLKQQIPSIINLLPNYDQFTFQELLDKCFEKGCETNNAQMVDLAETLIEQLIGIAKDTLTY